MADPDGTSTRRTLHRLIADLNAHAGHDLRSRTSGVIAGAGSAINDGDPADCWDEFQISSSLGPTRRSYSSITSSTGSSAGARASSPSVSNTFRESS